MVESSVNKSRRHDVAVRVLEGSKNKVGILVSDLGTVFRQKAPGQGVRVLRGSKGSCPHEVHVVDLLLGIWDRLSQTKKDTMMAEYMDGYIGRIKIDRPKVLQTTLGAGAHEQ